jgi:signal transduction histidine kinase
VTSRAHPPSLVDLNVVAREVLVDLEAHLDEVGGRVELADLPTIQADPLQMRQLLQNLIGNALKFSSTQRPPLVRIRATPSHPGSPCVWEIFFEDNGIGFEEQYAERIFKMFQRVHDRGSYEGAGMGLAICRKIVERHGGAIAAKSSPGIGSTFIVKLPSQQRTQQHDSVALAANHTPMGGALHETAGPAHLHRDGG